MMYGFYSAKADKQCGTTFWENPNGQLVKVTYVSENPEGSNYGWDDKVCVGPVLKYAKVGSPGKHEFHKERTYCVPYHGTITDSQLKSGDWGEYFPKMKPGDWDEIIAEYFKGKTDV